MLSTLLFTAHCSQLCKLRINKTIGQAIKFFYVKILLFLSIIYSFITPAKVVGVKNSGLAGHSGVVEVKRIFCPAVGHLIFSKS